MMRCEFQKASDWWVEDDSEGDRSRVGEHTVAGAHSHVPARADGAFTGGTVVRTDRNRQTERIFGA